jgi:hypothetical protein
MEGMVHALQQMHKLLSPHGLLVNVHDLPVPARIEVHSPEKISRVGWLLDKDDFKEERCATNALAQVVTKGDFILEDERDFSRNIHVDDLNEFQALLAEKWTSAILPDSISQRLEALLLETGQPVKIVVASHSRMTKLRAV